jgi:hypothetical protein
LLVSLSCNFQPPIKFVCGRSRNLPSKIFKFVTIAWVDAPRYRFCRGVTVCLVWKTTTSTPRASVNETSSPKIVSLSPYELQIFFLCNVITLWTYSYFIVNEKKGFSACKVYSVQVDPNCKKAQVFLSLFQSAPPPSRHSLPNHPI